MTFSGPQLRETQSKLHLTHVPEHSRWEYLRGGVHARSTFETRAGSSSSAHWTQDPAGDGSKFHAGFFRRRVDWGPAREAEDASRGAAFSAHDGARRAFLAAAASQSGFNPITGAEAAPQKDTFRPRGRVCVLDGRRARLRVAPHPAASPIAPPTHTHAPRPTPLCSAVEDGAGPLRLLEGATRDAGETIVRLHRIEDPALPRVAHRAGVLAREGLTVTTKNSSDLGYGRKRFPSAGVAEALGGAAYGGTTAATAADFAATRAAATEAADVPLHIIKSGVADRTVWDVRGASGAGVTERCAADQTARAQAATARSPNRVFDFSEVHVIGVAQPDPWVRAHRENRDIERSRVRPADRPASFTATTRHVAALRVHAEKAAEVASVRALG